MGQLPPLLIVSVCDFSRIGIGVIIGANMTFISTALAMDGVSLISDSLVTFSRSIIEYDVLHDYFKKKFDAVPEEDTPVQFDPQEVFDLFEPITHLGANPDRASNLVNVRTLKR